MPDVGEAPLLLELVGLGERAHVGEDAVLEADEEDDRVLETLGRVQRHQRDLGLVRIEGVGVGDQAHRFEEVGDLLVLLRRPDQLGQVLEPALGLDGAARCGARRGSRWSRAGARAAAAGPSSTRADGVVEELDESADAADGAAGDAGIVGVAEPVDERHAPTRDPLVDAGDAGVADAPLGGVEDPLDADLVGRVDHRLDVGRAHP